MENEHQKCPLCGNGALVEKDNMVFCDQKLQREKGLFEEANECDFHISFKQKLFNKPLTKSDINTLVQGGVIKNEAGDTMTLSLEADNGHFVKINFIAKT